MHSYPQATLQDIYKSFFQDRFGVAHALADCHIVEQHILKECQNAERFEECYVEPCGWRNDYFRINLKAVKEGKISAQELAQAFVASYKPVASEDIRRWQTEWQGIEKIAEEFSTSINNFETDADTIATLLQLERYAVHHSQQYNQAYTPHYRIVNREQYNQLKDRLK